MLLQAGRVLSLVPERAFWESEVQISRETITALLQLCVETLEVSTATASFAADKDAILGQIRVGQGLPGGGGNCDPRG